MRDPLITFLELVYPFFISFALLALIPLVKLDEEHKVNLSLYGISVPLPIRSKFVVRIALAIAALYTFCIPAFKDYTRLFPTHYDMEVFFDNRGIEEESFADYSQEELSSLMIADDWRKQKAEYLQKLSNDISKHLGVDDFFTIGPDYVHSSGRTTFFVDRVEGWQTYHIREATGALDHVREIPNGTPKKFHSSFELLKTPNNYIKANLLDIYVRWTKILKPNFKQIVNLTPAGDQIIYHHNVIAVIKIRFFPIARIGNTIYLVKGGDGTKWVPIGYAIYEPSK